MAVEPVTPVPGQTSEVVQGGTAIVVFLGGPNGGVLTNPASPDDQNIGGFVENLFVNPVGDATLFGNGTTFSLQPGQSWEVIPGQTTRTSVNAQTSGHRFSAVSW